MTLDHPVRRLCPHAFTFLILNCPSGSGLVCFKSLTMNLRVCFMLPDSAPMRHPHFASIEASRQKDQSAGQNRADITDENTVPPYGIGTYGQYMYQNHVCPMRSVMQAVSLDARQDGAHRWANPKQHCTCPDKKKM